MAQSMIMDYINDRLSIQELEKFLHHMKTCCECREELGVYYTIVTGMRKLDHDEELSMDFRGELEWELKRSEDKINHYKGNKIARRILFLVIILACLGIDYAVDIIREEPEKSNFKLEEYFFNGRDSKTDQYIRDHYYSIMVERMAHIYGNNRESE